MTTKKSRLVLKQRKKASRKWPIKLGTKESRDFNQTIILVACSRARYLFHAEVNMLSGHRSAMSK